MNLSSTSYNLCYMKHVEAVRGDYYQDLQKAVEDKIQELQKAGNDTVNISIGGRGSESAHDWIALILYDKK